MSEDTQVGYLEGVIKEQAAELDALKDTLHRFRNECAAKKLQLEKENEQLQKKLDIERGHGLELRAAISREVTKNENLSPILLEAVAEWDMRDDLPALVDIIYETRRQRCRQGARELLRHIEIEINFEEVRTELIEELRTFAMEGGPQ